MGSQRKQERCQDLEQAAHVWAGCSCWYQKGHSSGQSCYSEMLVTDTRCHLLCLVWVWAPGSAEPYSRGAAPEFSRHLWQGWGFTNGRSSGQLLVSPVQTTVHPQNVLFHYNVDEKKNQYPPGPLSVWGLHALPTAAEIFSGNFGFFPHPKDGHSRWTGGSTLSQTDPSECVCACVGGVIRPWNGQVCCPAWVSFHCALSAVWMGSRRERPWIEISEVENNCLNCSYSSFLSLSIADIYFTV